MMAAELGLLSLNQLKKLAQSQQQRQSQPPNTSSAAKSGMWNPKQVTQDEDDSWEVRAFEQDSGNITWPPRSYTCSFCRREFRSAQALGGHMNVHRRDRAQLHQAPPGTNNPTSSSAASSALLIPAQEYVKNGGLCLLYSLPNPNGILTPTTVNSCIDSPSTLLSVSPFQTNNLIPSCPPTYTYPVTPHSINSSISQSSNTEPSASNSNDNNHDNSDSKKDSAIEDLDLVLRLGRR